MVVLFLGIAAIVAVMAWLGHQAQVARHEALRRFSPAARRPRNRIEGELRVWDRKLGVTVADCRRRSARPAD